MMEISELAFAATSEEAFAEAQKILFPLKIARMPLNRFRASRRSVNMLARDRVSSLFRATQRPCFTIESALLPNSDHDTNTVSDRWYDEIDVDQSTFCKQFAPLRGIVTHVLAYTANGADIVLFQRDMPGQISSEPCDGAGAGFDRIWIPHGYTKPYAALATNRLALNKRRRLLYDLADYLRLPVKEGFFEVHITVDDENQETFSRFKNTCSEFGIKAIRIELPRGSIPTHLITGSFHLGTFQEVYAEAESIAATLAARGFNVTRIKIESTMNNDSVPKTDQEAAQRPDSNYFEFHVKIPITNDQRAAEAKAICKNYGAYLSRNPSNQMNDGIPLRFCTLRIRGKGKQSAIGLFERFLSDLRGIGFKLSNILREYTLFDSNLGLDDGWAKSLDQTKFCFSECPQLQLGDCPFAVDYDYIAAPEVSD
jgi:hypothetical protein